MKSEGLANRLQEVYLDGQWIANTNFKDQLEKFSFEQATQQVGSLNTIALLTFHINYYLDGLLHSFQTGSLEIRDKYSFDAPDLKSPEDWDHLRNDLLMNAEKFVKAVREMSNEQLDQPFIKEEYGTYERNIDATIEHSYYHLGQISLIGKLILLPNVG